MSEARAKLKSAIAKVADLNKQIERLEAAAGRSDAAAEQAKAELAKYADVDKEITAWRVAQVKKGLPTKTLPEKLKGKVDAKRAAEEELSQAEGTRDALKEELEEVRARLKPLENDKVVGAVGYLLEHADVLARELMQLNVRQWELRQILGSLQGVTVFMNGRKGGFPRTETMEAALNGYHVQFVQICDPYFDMAGRWKQRLEAILADPDVILTMPKPIVPADYSFKETKSNGPDRPWDPPVALLRAEN